MFWPSGDLSVLSALVVLIFGAVALGQPGPTTAPSTAPSTQPAMVRIVIVGDSTVSNYPKADPSRGWGQYIEEAFLEGRVKVVNLATPGRSTKTFIQEGRWRKALDEKPDYVFIQFGHNDSHAPGNPESTDASTDYRDYLRRYVDESRQAGATPILITPMVRRSFDAQGHLIDAQPPSRELKSYADAMKAVAEEKKVALIDLQASSKALMEKLGPDEAGKLANKKGDITHFNEKGARAMAELVLHELPSAAPSLKEHLKP